MTSILRRVLAYLAYWLSIISISLNYCHGWLFLGGWLTIDGDYHVISCVYIDLYKKLYKLYKLYMCTTTIIWFFMIFNTIQPIQWANGSIASQIVKNPDRGHRKAAVHLAGLGSCKGTAWGARLYEAQKSHRSHRVFFNLRKPSVLQHLRYLQSSTEFWKWKKVRAPQLAEKVGDRNQDKRLATLRTFKKNNFGNSNFQILIL